MESYYDFAGVVLKAQHADDYIFKKIDEELRYYRTERKQSDCTVRFNRDPHAAVPKKAIRTNALKTEFIYLDGGRMFIADKEGRYIISMSIAKKELAIDYTENPIALRNLLRWLLKWLVIKTAEGKGLAFIHASAASYHGKTILFSGDSNCGKSSALLRLVRKGARAISDDSVITDGKRIFHFTFKTSVDGDFARRFGIPPGLYDIGKFVDRGQSYDKADLLIFLKIWNNETSEMRPLKYDEALLSLVRIYKKEIPFLWSGLGGDGTKVIFEKYASILENAKCFEFCQGSDEDEVSRTLLDFLDRVR
jgi:hypothetical protein